MEKVEVVEIKVIGHKPGDYTVKFVTVKDITLNVTVRAENVKDAVSKVQARQVRAQNEIAYILNVKEWK